jgi:hypothetical protein
MALRITGILCFIHYPAFYEIESTAFRILDLFPSSGHGTKMPILLGPLERLGWRDCSQKNRTGRPCSRFHILLWSFTWLPDNVRRFRPELGRQKSLLLYHDNASSHTSFSPGNFWPNEYYCCPHPSHSPDMAPSTFLCFPPYWNNWGDRGIIAGGAAHPQETQLAGCISKWQKGWEQCIRVDGDYLGRDVVQ